MAFKFMVFAALLALTSAGVLHPVTYAHVANPAADAVATTHQNVVHSFDGTVAHYTKNIVSPYSSVHKSDTRISNNDYTPTVTKTVGYAEPSQSVYEYQETTPVVYTHAEAVPTATVYTHVAPVSKTLSYGTPAPAHVYHHAAPATKALSYDAPAPVYHHAAPVATTTYKHGPAAATYAHNYPSASAYGSSQTVHYSPAEMVSHISFDGFGTHWGF